MSTLPPIDSSVLPADVRKAPQADQDRYKGALAFERQLVEQLTEQLAKSAEPTGDDDGQGGDAAQGAYRQMLPGALADSVMQAGGLGLARTIAQSLKEAGK